MALPVTIPNEFANATASIPLSQLDANFNTLANAVNGISDGSETLANVTATVGNITTVNATTVDTTNIEVTNIKAKDGTAAGSIADSTGVVTLASSVLTTTDINGGTIDGTAIGGASAAAGSFTTLNTSGQVVFNDAGADVDFRVEGDTNANLLFVDAGNDRAGIGTGTPLSKFEVKQTADNYFTGGFRISRINNDTQYGTITNLGGLNLTVVETVFSSPVITFNSSTDGSTITERARITSGGVLCVNTTDTISGADKFSVSSPANHFGATIQNTTYNYATLFLANSATANDNVWVRFDDGTSSRGNIDFNRAAGLVRYNTSSDANLKNILGDSDGAKSVEILNSTRIREFAWKDDETQKPQIGVIAQELYETYKGAVSVGGDVERERDVTEEVEEEYTDENGETQTRTVTKVVGKETYTEYRPWAVDKTAFTFHLVAGWQAHEKLIKQQAETIAALEARIAALENA